VLSFFSFKDSIGTPAFSIEVPGMMNIFNAENLPVAEFYHAYFENMTRVIFLAQI